MSKSQSEKVAWLWFRAVEAYEAYHGRTHTIFHLAAYGYPNARAIVQDEYEELTQCPCGEYEPCPGVDTHERKALRKALRDLLEALPAASGEDAPP